GQAQSSRPRRVAEAGDLDLLPAARRPGAGYGRAAGDAAARLGRTQRRLERVVARTGWGTQMRNGACRAFVISILTTGGKRGQGRLTGPLLLVSWHRARCSAGLPPPARVRCPGTIGSIWGRSGLYQ